jgi:hypothetical protein
MVKDVCSLSATGTRRVKRITIADMNSGLFLWDARTRNPGCRSRGARDGAGATPSLRAPTDGANAGGECAVRGLRGAGLANGVTRLSVVARGRSPNHGKSPVSS